MDKVTADNFLSDEIFRMEYLLDRNQKIAKVVGAELSKSRILIKERFEAIRSINLYLIKEKDSDKKVLEVKLKYHREVDALQCKIDRLEEHMNDLLNELLFVREVSIEMLGTFPFSVRCQQC